VTPIVVYHERGSCQTRKGRIPKGQNVGGSRGAGDSGRAETEGENPAGMQ